MKEAWNGIDVFLKKRYDLDPNLVRTVKGYTTHETQLLERITALRTAAMQSTAVNERIATENELGKTISQVFVFAENYPDLKANINFLELQTQLGTIEGEIEMSRRYYNGTVRENNIAVESFPAMLIARAFRFETGPFYEIEDKQQRESINVSF